MRLSWAIRVAAAMVVPLFAVAYVGCSDILQPLAGGDGGSDGNPNDVNAASTDADLGEGDGMALLDAGALDVRAAKLDCTGQDAAFGPPNDLGCTGLYADYRKRTVSAGAKEFDPGLRQWSDGADSTRWIALPAGQAIDTTDMNEWKFPIGTKLWQELRVRGHRVETRHFWKRGMTDWVRTTYKWSADEGTAQAFATGAQNLGGTAYAIRAVSQCDTCHAGRIDKVLGFDAVSLSSPTSTYDGHSPAMTAVAPLLTEPPAVPLTIPDDPTRTAAPALGWLHANCGACHNASKGAAASVTGLRMRLEVGPAGLGSYDSTSTYKTAVCQTSRFQQAAPTGGWMRVFPGHLEKSLLPFRSGQRKDPELQMPPIATNIPDLDGTRLVEEWVRAGTFPSHQAPCPQP